MSRSISPVHDEPTCYSSDPEATPDLPHLTSRTPHSRTASPDDGHRAATRPPTFIILALWSHPQDAQIQYYTTGYAHLYPRATIIPLQTHHEMDSLLHLLVEENPPPLEEACSRGTDERARVLVHVFGNESAHHLCRFLRAFRAKTGERLDVQAVVFDDVPARIAPRLREIVASPLLLLLVFVGMVLGDLLAQGFAWSGWAWIPGMACPGSVHRELNGSTLLPQKTRKCYVMSRGNVMFAWNEGGRGDEVAERRAMQVRRHGVGKIGGKWSLNEERYWLGIENAWDG